MPPSLVVPALRLSMVFLNVYETFKILKIPPPSSHSRDGRPSVRAMTQRKRNLKGCLAVWIIWCAFATYERLFDRIVSMLVPFYNEIKSIILLFLILTRARGAEPIFLHVLRPFIKPYTSTIDTILDLARMIGDILFLCITWPSSLILSWCQNGPLAQIWPFTATGRTGPFYNYGDPTIDARRVVHEANIDISLQREYHPRSALNHSLLGPQDPYQTRPEIRHGDPIDASHGIYLSPRPPHVIESASGQFSTIPTEGIAGTQARQQAHIRHINATSPPANDGVTAPYQIWYPPQLTQEDNTSIRPSYSDASLNSESRAPLPGAPPLSNPHSSVALSGATQIDEWRLYPPFPSAYPPTPLPAISSLPTLNSASMPVFSRPQFVSDKTPFPVIVEVNEKQQDFGESLLQPREPADPSSRVRSSDSHSITKGDQSSMSNNEKSMSEESEDDFNVTLHTPLSARLRTHSNASTAASSFPSPSTVLSTVDNGSSLRTRTNSESSRSTSTTASSSTSGASSSVVGHKRGRSRGRGAVPGGVQNRIDAYERVWSGNNVIGIRLKPGFRASDIKETANKDSTTDEDEGVTDDTEDPRNVDSDEAHDGRLIPGVKRRRIAVSSKPTSKISRTMSLRSDRGKSVGQDRPTRDAESKPALLRPLRTTAGHPLDVPRRGGPPVARGRTVPPAAARHKTAVPLRDKVVVDAGK